MRAGNKLPAVEKDSKQALALIRLQGGISFMPDSKSPLSPWRLCRN